MDGLKYRVKAGDTLHSVSVHYKVTVESLSRANGIIDVNRISIGQTLTIPIAGSASLASQLLKPHRVFAGETLCGIARHYSTTVEAIARTNNIHKINSIRIGQTLLIPVSVTEDQQSPSPKFPEKTPSDGELVSIDGQDYLLKIRNNRASIVPWTKAGPATSPSPSSAPLPRIWIITRENGFPLFALRIDNVIDVFDPVVSNPDVVFGQTKGMPFRTLTAKQLYSRGIQWFEPLADNYRELIWTYAGSDTAGSNAYPAYKHFLWKDIIDFSVVDRWSASYRTGGEGDWKKSSKGGDGFLLVLVEGYPYWGDAIGQIPFAVDTFKESLESTGDKEKSIVDTIKTGLAHGDGSILPTKEDDPNKYDNFMILRGSLWASENHRVTRRVKKWLFDTFETTSFDVQYKFEDSKSLSTPISESLLQRYGVWRK